jgi:hypothetical protein
MGAGVRGVEILLPTISKNSINVLINYAKY